MCMHAHQYLSAISKEDVAVLVRSHMNGLQPFETEYNRTNNRNNVPSPKTITAATTIKQKQLTTAARLLISRG